MPVNGCQAAGGAWRRRGSGSVQPTWRNRPHPIQATIACTFALGGQRAERRQPFEIGCVQRQQELGPSGSVLPDDISGFDDLLKELISVGHRWSPAEHAQPWTFLHCLSALMQPSPHDCGDFSTRSEAQALYMACGGRENDVHRLDRDRDGWACEACPEIAPGMNWVARIRVPTAEVRP